MQGPNANGFVFGWNIGLTIRVSLLIAKGSTAKKKRV